MKREPEDKKKRSDWKKIAWFDQRLQIKSNDEGLKLSRKVLKEKLFAAQNHWIKLNSSVNLWIDKVIKLTAALQIPQRISKQTVQLKIQDH